MPSFTDISDRYTSSCKLAEFDSLAQLLKSPKTKVLVDKGTVVAEVPYRNRDSLITLSSKFQVIKIMLGVRNTVRISCSIDMIH